MTTHNAGTEETKRKLLDLVTRLLQGDSLKVLNQSYHVVYRDGTFVVKETGTSAALHSDMY